MLDLLSNLYIVFFLKKTIFQLSLRVWKASLEVVLKKKYALKSPTRLHTPPKGLWPSGIGLTL